MIDFYTRIEELRVDLGFNKKEFSLKLNMQNSNYATLLKGKTANGELAKNLYQLFNVNLNWLLMGVGEMYNDELATRHHNVANLARYYISNIIDTFTKYDTINSVFLGVANEKSLEFLTNVAIGLLKDELNKLHYVINAENMNYSDFIQAFEISGNNCNTLLDIQRVLYGAGITWIIKGLTLSNIDKVEKVYQDLTKILNDANLKGITPKGNLVFIDYACVLEENYSLFGKYVVGNLNG